MQKPWPWQEDKEKWFKLFWKSVYITTFNIFVFNPVNLFIATKINFKVDMNIDTAPSLNWMLPQFVIMMLVEDFMFFTFHRLLHHPLFYKYHKIHHEFTTTVAIAGLHFHILEFFFVQSFFLNQHGNCFVLWPTAYQYYCKLVYFENMGC